MTINTETLVTHREVFLGKLLFIMSAKVSNFFLLLVKLSEYRSFLRATILCIYIYIYIYINTHIHIHTERRVIKGYSRLVVTSYSGELMKAL